MEFLIKKIEELTRDRVIQVQQSARSALKVWRKLQNKLEDLDRGKMNYDEADGSGTNRGLKTGDEDEDEAFLLQKFGPGSKPQKGPKAGATPSQTNLEDSLEGLRSDSKSSGILLSINSLTKMNSIQRGFRVYRDNNITERTYLKQKALNFQKKRSGTGGGYIKNIDRYSKANKRPTYNTMWGKLRNQVLKDQIDFTQVRRSRGGRGRPGKGGIRQFRRQVFDAIDREDGVASEGLGVDFEEEDVDGDQAVGVGGGTERSGGRVRSQRLKNEKKGDFEDGVDGDHDNGHGEELRDSIEVNSKANLSKKFNNFDLESSGRERRNVTFGGESERQRRSSGRNQPTNAPEEDDVPLEIEESPKRQNKQNLDSTAKFAGNLDSGTIPERTVEASNSEVESTVLNTVQDTEKSRNSRGVQVEDTRLFPETVIVEEDSAELDQTQQTTETMNLSKNYTPKIDFQNKLQQARNRVRFEE